MPKSKLPRIVEGAQYDTLKKHSQKDSKEKINYHSGTPQHYQPQSQGEYDQWVKRGKLQEEWVGQKRKYEGKLSVPYYGDWSKKHGDSMQEVPTNLKIKKFED